MLTAFTAGAVRNVDHYRKAQNGSFISFWNPRGKEKQVKTAQSLEKELSTGTRIAG